MQTVIGLSSEQAFTENVKEGLDRLREARSRCDSAWEFQSDDRISSGVGIEDSDSSCRNENMKENRQKRRLKRIKQQVKGAGNRKKKKSRPMRLDVILLSFMKKQGAQQMLGSVISFRV